MATWDAFVSDALTSLVVVVGGVAVGMLVLVVIDRLALRRRRRAWIKRGRPLAPRAKRPTRVR